MKVEHVRGSLLDAPEYFILHQVNCQGVMGSGVAKAIRKQYPEVYDIYIYQYNKTLKKHGDTSILMGHCQTLSVPNHTIINMFSQYTYGIDGIRYTNYEAFYNGLESVLRHIKAANPADQTLAIPYKIGCNRGGADWNVIIAMIASVFEDTNIKITFYEYNP